jgi:hypothetical protein
LNLGEHRPSQIALLFLVDCVRAKKTPQPQVMSAAKQQRKYHKKQAGASCDWEPIFSDRTNE